MLNENDYMNISKEYEFITNETKQEINFYKNIILQIQSFANIINTLGNRKFNKEEYNIQNNFLNLLDKNNILFHEKIQNLINRSKNELLDPLNNLYDNYYNKSNINIKNLEQIKNNLNDQENKLNKAKNIYLNLNDTNNSKNNSENNLKENYKSEINIMNQIIDESNINYEKIYNSINTLNNNNIYNLKELFLKYCEIINEIGNMFFEYSGNISQNLNYLDELYNNQNKYKKSKDRFEKINMDIFEKENINININKKNKSDDNSFEDENLENNEFDAISDIDINLDDFIDKDLTEDINKNKLCNNNNINEIDNDKKDDINKKEENNTNSIIENKKLDNKNENSSINDEILINNDKNKNLEKIEYDIKENIIKDNILLDNEKLLKENIENDLENNKKDLNELKKEKAILDENIEVNTDLKQKEFIENDNEKKKDKNFPNLEVKDNNNDNQIQIDILN